MYFDRQTIMTSANARGTRLREARLIFICMRLATSDITIAGEHNTEADELICAVSTFPDPIPELV